MEDLMKQESVLSSTRSGKGVPFPEPTNPETPHPIVVDGLDGRFVVCEGGHRLADQLQRQGACIVQHVESGELFAVVRYTDGSVRRCR